MFDSDQLNLRSPDLAQRELQRRVMKVLSE
jgi:hypothetical protein